MHTSENRENKQIYNNMRSFTYHRFFAFWTIFFVFDSYLIDGVQSKYVEGTLRTLQDWAFLARFCFISGRGRFEYQIEFERRYGEPQLLLYYDDVSQWPAVYKTKTTCQQKLSVLSTSDNQIITLSVRPPYSFNSGCTMQSKNDRAIPALPIATPTPMTFDHTYFDQFLQTSTETTAEEQSNGTDAVGFGQFNETDTDAVEVFNGTSQTADSYYSISANAVTGNSLENGTDFLDDVEELFDATHSPNRIRRSIPRTMNFNRGGRGTYVVTCSNVGGFTSSRERWWYIAIANCGSGKGINISYRFRLTNGPPGDIWTEHFSADEMYILPILLVEAMIYALIVLAVFICSIKLKALHLLHCTFRIFSFSVTLHALGVSIQAIAYLMYATSGLAPHTVLGALFMGAGEVMFLALMLLLAKGYTITRARLSSSSMIKLTLFLNVYIISYISLFIFENEYFDPGEVMNLYESPAGFGLAGLRIGACVAFLISTVTTLKKNPEKIFFYCPFGFLGSLWIIGGPIVTVLGIFVLDAWVRESVICGVQAWLAICAHTTFLFLTWPSRANTSFPYHVRTNHVGIASEDDDGADYPRHAYEPSLAEQNTIIPLSRRTEELLNGVYGQYLNDHLGYDVENPRANYPRAATAPPEHALVVGNDDQGTTLNQHTNNLEMQQSNNTDSMHDDDTDSGHPSFDNPADSPPETTTPPSATNRSTNPLADPLLNFNGTAKPNPFIVNGVQRAPNRIILDPIELPLPTSASSPSSSATRSAVPRHLFAIKKTDNK